MHNVPTYKQQFNKLTEAYIAGRVNPYLLCACFVGNLLNGDEIWAMGRTMSHNLPLLDTYKSARVDERWTFVMLRSIHDNAGDLYTPVEIVALEKMFMVSYIESGGSERPTLFGSNPKHEDALFIAFERTLDLLKEIHESKGEVIEENIPIFTRRELVLA